MVTEFPPLRLGAIAGDAIHNLRSALDILWRHAMYPKGGRSGRKDPFPFLASAEMYEARLKREKEGFRQKAVRLVQAPQTVRAWE